MRHLHCLVYSDVGRNYLLEKMVHTYISYSLPHSLQPFCTSFPSLSPSFIASSERRERGIRKRPFGGGPLFQVAPLAIELAGILAKLSGR